MKRKILVVDDDKKTVELIALYLERDHYQVLTAYDGARALETARLSQPDLVVLDWMLPEIDGLDVCRVLRSESKVPIIMLTARSTEFDKILGLDLGADDYLTKPFSPKELLARIRVVLRRATPPEQVPNEVSFGELAVNFSSREVQVGGKTVHLTPKEFKLLELMVREPGRAFSRLELLERVFSVNYEGFERSVDVHLKNLRKKIEPRPEEPVYFHTVYGFGYKFWR